MEKKKSSSGKVANVSSSLYLILNPILLKPFPEEKWRPDVLCWQK
jgi:hypothetical protein